MYKSLTCLMPCLIAAVHVPPAWQKVTWLFRFHQSEPVSCVLSSVFLNMSTFLHPASTIGGRTVALGIRGQNLHLSCRKDGDSPTLHLERLEDNSLLNISSDSDMVRFLFYKQDTGVNISTLMSVAQPNWYISTAEQNNKPVEMCQETAKRYRSFNIGDIQGNVERQS